MGIPKTYGLSSLSTQPSPDNSNQSKMVVESVSNSGEGSPTTNYKSLVALPPVSRRMEEMKKLFEGKGDKDKPSTNPPPKIAWKKLLDSPPQ